MFQATPAKRPRRETWSDKLSSATETIALAIATEKKVDNENNGHVYQVLA